MKRVRSTCWFQPPLIFRTPYFHLLALVVAGLTAGQQPIALAEDLPGSGTLALSLSGQFAVTGSTERSPLLRLPAVTTNASFVRLEPALLSISAERIKQAVYRLLEIPVNSPWQGKIYLRLRPALWTDEKVTVVSRPIDQTWDYLVQLPDVVQQGRYLRGMVGVLLLELANRQAVSDIQSPEVPDWLIDGLAQQVMQDELSQAIVSSPDQPLDSPPPREAATRERNLDTLATARQVLRQNPALTFDQLNWPTEAQLSGQDGGVYLASAQLFVAELRRLNGGSARLQQMIAALAQCRNWQTAFQIAWHDRFPTSLAVEKWWALTVVNFLARDPGPAWTPFFSASRLNELLSVPVNVRVSSNAFPIRAEITWQQAIHEFSPAQQGDFFETRLRDLRLAQLRMAPQFIALADDYCRVLAGYLGEPLDTPPRVINARHASSAPTRLPAREALKRLDALDARRRTLEAAIQPRNVNTPPSLIDSPSGAVNLTGRVSKL